MSKESTKNNDSKIKSLFSQVESKKKQLGARPRISLKTNAIFKYADTNFFNINTVTNPQVLVEALSFLLSRENSITDAADILGVEINSSWNGSTVMDWIEDFKSRVSVIKYDIEAKKLAALEGKLNGLISEEAKTEIELESIENLLK